MSRLNTFLSGIKVLDLSQYIPGPMAGLILAESFVIVRLFRRDIRSLAIGIAIAAIGAGLIVYGLGA